MLWRESEHEPLSSHFWTAGWAREALEEIVADAEAAPSPEGEWPYHPRDEIEDGEVWSGLYLGAAGMAWGLWKLGSGSTPPGRWPAPWSATGPTRTSRRIR